MQLHNGPKSATPTPSVKHLRKPSMSDCQDFEPALSTGTVPKTDLDSVEVSNLHSPRETDFESVVVTTWLGPVQIVPHRHHHEQIFKVSNLHSPRKTDFESIVVTTWLGSVKIDLHRNQQIASEKTIHE
ncbi:hypothetical protein EV702DRAFT_1048907 [Suillus placidus]|uniref:Uncharacterized protein n=1 Tax=Suillus placidus TaxID=48579 RepID=A0A9P7CYY8_9AGAM|nr:hypothetical protein EV702DRAFT_1048907 [Suillus placidus]